MDKQRTTWLVQAVLHSLTFVREPAKRDIDRVMVTMVTSRALGVPAKDFRQAIQTVLASNERLADFAGGRHSEKTVRLFLGEILTRLSAEESRA